jgi:hypothetical protein
MNDDTQATMRVIKDHSPSRSSSIMMQTSIQIIEMAHQTTTLATEQAVIFQDDDDEELEAQQQMMSDKK